MIQIAAVAVISAVLVIYLRNLNAELAVLASICAGIIVLGMTANYLSGAVSVIEELVKTSGIDASTYKIILKITAIGYIAEFSSGLLEDFGMKGMANKLIFAGKAVILCMSMPIIYGVLQLVTGLLK